MSLYISNKQLVRRDKEESSVPLLLVSPSLGMQHRIFSEDFEFAPLLMDAYQLTNLSGKVEPYFLLPCGCMTMIFMAGPQASYSTLCGPLTVMRRLLIPAKSVVFCVRLKVGSGDYLAGNSASMLVDRTVPLFRHLPGADQLLYFLRRAESFHERCVMVFRTLSARGAKSYQASAVLRRCVALMDESQGLLRISQVAETVGYSERYVNRIFQERVGISPKLYSQIIQLHSSFYSILTQQPKHLLDTAVTYGYFDQAHMNRSYRKFLGYTAGDIRYTDIQSIIADDIPSTP